MAAFLLGGGSVEGREDYGAQALFVNVSVRPR
jgi:hypothetical protein